MRIPQKVFLALKFFFQTDFHNCHNTPFSRIVLITFLVCTPISTFFLWQKTPREIPLQPDGHGQLSLELAINRAICGTTSHTGENNSLRAFLSGNVDVAKVPIKELPNLLAGSKEMYCQMVNTPFVNNENSLMLLELLLLKTSSNLSLLELGYYLELVRIGGFFIFAVFLMRIGLSPFFVGSIFFISLALTNAMYPYYYYSYYPFFLPALLSFISVLGFFVSEKMIANSWTAVGLGFSFGLCAAFIVNLRSSYSVIVYLIIFLYFLFSGTEILGSRQVEKLKIILLYTLPLFSLIFGFYLFQKVFIYPIEEIGINTQYNYSYHAVAHPLVLGLALPPNRFAEKEGIKWEDLVGLNLARKIDPEATYLGPTYEKALFSYYINLWIFHREEMVFLYQEKFRLAGRSILDAFWNKDILLVKWLLWPFHFLQTGIAYLALWLIMFLVLLTLWLRKWISSGLAFFLISFCGSSILLFLESAIIMPYFVVAYHACLSLWMFFLGLLFIQGIINLFGECSQRFVKQLQ